MSRVFVDTSYYVAAVNPRDALHPAALSLARTFAGQMVTTEFILLEVGNWLGRSGDREVFGICRGSSRHSDRKPHMKLSSTSGGAGA